MSTPVDVDSSHAKMVACVKAMREDSDAFVPSRAKMAACMSGRTVQRKFQVVTKISVKMEECVLL